MPENQQSLRSLVDELATEIALLCQQKVSLAKIELSEHFTQVCWTLAGLLLGITLALVGVATVVAAAVLTAIESGMRPGLATSLVGLGVLTGGAVIAWRMVTRLRSAAVLPRHTITSIKEDAAWVKRQMSE